MLKNEKARMLKLSTCDRKNRGRSILAIVCIYLSIEDIKATPFILEAHCVCSLFRKNMIQHACLLQDLPGLNEAWYWCMSLIIRPLPLSQNVSLAPISSALFCFHISFVLVSSSVPFGNHFLLYCLNLHFCLQVL